MTQTTGTASPTSVAMTGLFGIIDDMLLNAKTAMEKNNDSEALSYVNATKPYFNLCYLRMKDIDPSFVALEKREAQPNFVVAEQDNLPEMSSAVSTSVPEKMLPTNDDTPEQLAANYQHPLTNVPKTKSNKI